MRILYSSPDLIKISVKSIGSTSKELEPVYCLIGLPDKNLPNFDVTYVNQMILNDIPHPEFPLGNSWIQSQNLKGLNTGTFMISPITSEGTAYHEVQVSIYISSPTSPSKIEINPKIELFLKNRVLNWEHSKNWLHPNFNKRNKNLNDIPDFTQQLIFDDTEYVIIGPNEFYLEIIPLISLRNNSVDPINTVFVSLDSIYQHYGNGETEASKIKLFFQDVLYISQEILIYGLLVGDVPIIPTMYEGNFASDDLYVTFDGGIPEIILGRFPAKSVFDVTAFVNKVIQYETEPEFGLWRQNITIVADDESRPYSNDTTHTSHSEELSGMIPPQLNVEKIYLMEYPESNDASIYGVTKPEATEVFFDKLNKGTAIINYIGHGSREKLAQESLLDKSRGDISLIQTGKKLPLWIVGTCSWGEFDNPDGDAFSEDIIRLDNNGAIAIITTSRGVYESSNWLLLKNLYGALFPNGEIVDTPIGLILQSIKTGSITGKIFHLFGDPAMSIQIPSGTLDLSVSEPLEVLSRENVLSQQYYSNNGGSGYLIVKESDRIVEREYSYVSHSGLENASISYSLPGTILSIVEVSFSSSQISGDFWIPLDITGNQIDINLYITTEDVFKSEAIGFSKNLEVLSVSEVNDFSGPEISMVSIDNRQIGYGDHINPNTDLTFIFSDPSGINLTREPGHEIQLLINESGLLFDLTDQFIYNPNDITTGTIKLQLNDFLFPLNAEIQCWDNANNSNSKIIYLQSFTESGLKLFSVYNFPNPFKIDTQFTFEITEDADIFISIFTPDGILVKEIPSTSFTAGYHHIYWNGKDNFGKNLYNGTFIYKITARTSDATTTKFNKLAILK